MNIMNSTIGNLPVFEVGSDWKVFKERLSIWLSANSIIKTETGGDRRRAVLLSAFDESAYKLVRELNSPKTLEELSYEEIVAEVDKHLLPKKSLFAERHHFHRANQKEDEDLTQWAARVRQLASDCKFGSVLDDMLRDRFVLGMRAGPVRDRLFTEDADTLTLARALEIAVSLHSARAASRQSAAPSNSNQQTESVEVFKVSRSSSSKSGVECEVCGYSNHTVDKCRFKGYKCKSCGNKGHLKRMCKSRKRVNMLHSIDESNDDDVFAG
ncbi:uncharacterized protein LOC125240842 [Leguminivora glycinivorella]|uniref:uncharacterized protein LOC125240842 n=1 Tax=Leguminivora glycinivorella TaxID=1035111 RepID=UPI00200E48DD|nr:uncharacterized protein LOC125240842 [Leguminivora glycinivorella]